MAGSRRFCRGLVCLKSRFSAAKIKGHGIGSTEHSAVDYKLTKKERTGAITIHYSSPEVLPFKFKWTAKVDVYGNVSSTPMKFEMPVENQGAGAAK